MAVLNEFNDNTNNDNKDFYYAKPFSEFKL